MEKYNIYKAEKEIKSRNTCDIVEGCTVSSDDIFSELIKTCDTLEEAREALKKYKTNITYYSGNVGGYFLIAEYYILPETYDEDGEIIESGDIQEFTKMKISIEDENWNIIKVFDNYKDAEDFVNNDERDLEIIY